MEKEILDLQTDGFEWLVQKGEIAERIRAIDWSQSPLGRPEKWPQSLRSAINICLASKIPMYVWWGPHYVNIYNDAYIPLAGKVRHPAYFGRPAREMWPEIWNTMEGFLEQIHETGEAIQHDDLEFVLERNDVEETCYFSFSFNPAYDEKGRVQGALAIVIETTARVNAEKKLAQEIKLRELAAEEVARFWNNVHCYDFAGCTSAPSGIKSIKPTYCLNSAFEGCRFVYCKKWRARVESNHRPSPSEGDTLSS